MTFFIYLGHANELRFKQTSYVSARTLIFNIVNLLKKSCNRFCRLRGSFIAGVPVA